MARVRRDDFYRIYPLTSLFPARHSLFLSFSPILALFLALFLSYLPFVPTASGRAVTSIEILFPFRRTPMAEEA